MPTTFASWPADSLKADESVPEEGGAHGWIQWKGTDVCMDVHCPCGTHSHLDDEFAYFIECPGCQQIYAVGATVRLYPVTPEVAAAHGDRAKHPIDV